MGSTAPESASPEVALVYRRFGKLEVRLLAPVNWSIGKLTRYLDRDIGDVAEIFRLKRIRAGTAANIWGRALLASPASTAQFQFRKNVEDFLRRQGRRIWGGDFNPSASLRRFERAARIDVTPDDARYKRGPAPIEKR